MRYVKISMLESSGG